MNVSLREASIIGMIKSYENNFECWDPVSACNINPVGEPRRCYLYHLEAMIILELVSASSWLRDVVRKRRSFKMTQNTFDKIWRRLPVALEY